MGEGERCGGGGREERGGEETEEEGGNVGEMVGRKGSRRRLIIVYSRTSQSHLLF